MCKEERFRKGKGVIQLCRQWHAAMSSSSRRLQKYKIKFKIGLRSMLHISLAMVKIQQSNGVGR